MLKKSIQEEDLLERVSDTDIFKKYFGDFDYCTSYHSTFRKDDDPSTGFYVTSKGRVIYNDLHPEGESYSSIGFVMKLFGLSFGDALKKIWNELVLDNEGNEKPLEFKNNCLEKVKEDKEFAIIPKPVFSDEALEYWNRYSITEKELKENEVYEIKRVFINGKITPNKKDDLKFAYRINNGDKSYLKIYTPSAKKFKWVGPVPLSCPFGWDELPFKSKTLIITKSQKDRIILKKFFTDVIALQNESLAALSEKQAQFLMTKYKRIILNFDCDKPGLKAANDFVKAYGWDTFTTPQTLWEEKKIKDCSDLVEEYGIEVLKKYLKKEKVLIND